MEKQMFSAFRVPGGTAVLHYAPRQTTLPLESVRKVTPRSLSFS